MRREPSFIAVALAALLAGCSRQPSPAAPGTSASSPARPQRRPPAAKPLETLADLDSLAAETPEYQGKGRNLFAFGRGGSTSGKDGKDDSLLPVAPPPVAVEPRPSGPVTPAAPRIDLKFAGYIEKPFPDGKKVKYAIFLDGQHVLTGAEGELVANRYRIVEIGLESVTLAHAGSNATQRIPLKTN